MPFNDLRRRRLWLAALHHLAIADGDFSAPEVALLEEELRRELPGVDWDDLHLPGAEALAHRFVPGSPLAEQFLRTAAVVALADGCISPIERELLQHWSAVLQVGEEALADLHDAPDRSLSAEKTVRPTCAHVSMVWEFSPWRSTDPFVCW
jgi:hypothetical protein